jgi:hypothetical protein
LRTLPFSWGKIAVPWEIAVLPPYSSPQGLLDYGKLQFLRNI